MKERRLGPWAPFSLFKGKFDRLFDDFFSDIPTIWERHEGFSPAIDVIDDKDSVTVKAEVLELTQKELKVELEDNILTIRGEKKHEVEVEGKDFYRYERKHGNFSRCIELPATVDATKAQATCKDGVLTIRIPKREAAKPRSISIDIE